MPLTVQVAFKELPVSDAIERRIIEEAEKLDRFAPDLVSCRVVVERPHRRGRKGRLHAIRIDLTLPGRAEIVVDRGHRHLDPAHEDLEVAIRDAFDAARRRLEDEVRLRRGAVKSARTPKPGCVIRLIPEEGYGFLDAGGVRAFFHRNSVADEQFDELRVGDEVQCILEEAEKGLNATAVRRTGGRRPVAPLVALH